MACATTVSHHLKLVKCFSTTILPKTHLSLNKSKPTCLSLPLRHNFHLSLNSIFKKSNLFVSFVSGSAEPELELEETETETGIEVESELGLEETGIEAESEVGLEETETETGIEAESEVDLEESDDSFAEPPEEAKLYVGNLPFDIDSIILADLFNQAGVVEISEVIYNRQTDQSRGFGFVTMRTVEEAEKAVEMFNRYDINGRLLTVNKAAPRGSQPERVPKTYGPSFRIYVGNLPWKADNETLEQVFSEYGKVVDARVVYDRENGRSKGFGFVTMSSEAELNDAIAALDGQNLDGRAIRVNVAEEKPRRNSF